MLILFVCGSLQSKSGNRTLLEIAASSLPEGVQGVFFEGLRDLPHFDPDLDFEAIASLGAWRRAIAESDALLVACPEYGHSLPGALKNAIDWVIGTGELERKVIGVTAAVPAKERGLRGLKALRDTLGAVSARVVGGEPILRGPSFEAEIAQLVRDLVARASSPERYGPDGLPISGE